jgi:hypothetical protein
MEKFPLILKRVPLIEMHLAPVAQAKDINTATVKLKNKLFTLLYRRMLAFKCLGYVDTS